MTSYIIRRIATDETWDIRAANAYEALLKVGEIRRGQINAERADRQVNRLKWIEAEDGGYEAGGKRYNLRVWFYTPATRREPTVSSDGPATRKQIDYIRSLSNRVQGGSIAIRTEQALAGRLDKAEASRLIGDMLAERG